MSTPAADLSTTSNQVRKPLLMGFPFAACASHDSCQGQFCGHRCLPHALLRVGQSHHNPESERDKLWCCSTSRPGFGEPHSPADDHKQWPLAASQSKGAHFRAQGLGLGEDLLLMVRRARKTIQSGIGKIASLSLYMRRLIVHS